MNRPAFLRVKEPSAFDKVSLIRISMKVVINLVPPQLASLRPSVNSTYFFFSFPLFPTLPHEDLELTFKSKDEILCCYHSNESSLVALSNCSIHVVCSCNF